MKYWVWVLISVLLVSCGETEKKRRTLGYKGEAKNNPFLAAERFLEEDGLEVHLEHGLSQFEDDVAVIFLPPSSVNTVGRAKRLEQWVRNGGHLVMMLDGGELGGNDFSPSPNPVSLFHDKSEQLGVDYLLERVGLKIENSKLFDPKEKQSKKAQKKEVEEVDKKPMKWDDWEELDEKDRVLLGSEKSEMKLGEEVCSIRHWSNLWVVDSGKPEEGKFASEEKEKSHRFLSVRLGDGRVTWLTDAHPLRNRFIAEADHARFLKSLIDLSRPGKIIFSKGSGDGLFSMLWRYFPLAILAFVLAVLFWLWRHLPRFGPPKEVSVEGSREFSGQVRGVGRFLWRQKREDAILDALRSQVNRRLSLRVGGVSDVDSTDAVFENLAEQSGLSVEEVTEAMTRKNVREAGAMVRVVKNLQKIRNQIL